MFDGDIQGVTSSELEILSDCVSLKAGGESRAAGGEGGEYSDIQVNSCGVDDIRGKNDVYRMDKGRVPCHYTFMLYVVQREYNGIES